MQEEIEITLNEKEKALLEKLAKDAGMTINDYIEYKLFKINPDYIALQADKESFLT